MSGSGASTCATPATRRPSAPATLLFRRGAVPDPAVRDAARRILADVRERGAAAVRDASTRFGGGRPDGRLLLTRRELARRRATRSGRAERDCPRDGHRQRPPVRARPSVPETRRARRSCPAWSSSAAGCPSPRAGVYAPGGSAPYPSSLVMGVVPARVAGVGAVVVATPGGPRAATSTPSCSAPPGLLGVDALLVAGGVQAIGALAYGLPDAGPGPGRPRSSGPGSAWVTAAKIEVVGEVGIDLPAGPSEGLVLADGSADVATVAADLITQAEHGVDSPPCW